MDRGAWRAAVHGVAELVTQSNLTLSDPMDCSLLAPLSMEFSKHEYWSGLPFPSPGDLPDPGIEPMSPELQADSLPSEPPGKLPALVQSLSNTVKLGCNLFCTF